MHGALKKSTRDWQKVYFFNAVLSFFLESETAHMHIVRCDMQ